MKQRPIADGLFTWPSNDPRLIGTKCLACDNHMFPTQSGCSRCMSTDVETVELANVGTLWAWTVQSFPPKSPPYLGKLDPFEPYGVGYVELAGQCRVETRITEADPAKLKTGMELQLTIMPLATDEEGNEIMTFAFEPTTDSAERTSS